ncbi:MAG: hypothetical protein Q3986_00820 [Akkermansia sp.]|nr:hypothetical protein [Akkermansia sp.]
MKLHLPKMLTAALIAAFAVTSAYATTTKTTMYEGDTVFNGDIWTWNNADTQSVSSGNSKYTNYTTGKEYAGNADMTSVGGPSAFWQAIQWGSETVHVGNTLRFADATTNVRLNTDYSNYVWVGGIITEAGNDGTYTLGRNANTSFRLQGSHSVNMIIKSNFTIWATDAKSSTEIVTGGTWNVEKDKVLTFSIPSLTHDAGQTVTITGAGTVKFDTRYIGQAGALFNVGEGATLNFANTAQLGGTITNAGTVTFGNTVSVADFSGFEGDVNYSADDNGFVLSATYTIWKGEGNVTGLSEISYGGKTLTVDETYHTVTVAEPDYTTYHLNTADASVVVDTAAAEAQEQGKALTTVNVKKTGATVTVNSELSLPTLSIASGADATIDGTGTLTLTTLNNSGTVNVAAGLTMANAVNYTSSETPAIHVKDGGVLTILSNSKVDGAQIGSATGEQVNGAFTKLFTGKVVDVQEGGKLVLKGNVVVCDSTTGSTEATMTSRISELEIQGGFQINTYAVNPGTTWELGSNTMRVTEYLWLTNHQFLTVEGGAVETGELRLGHSGNTAGGSYPAKLTATDGSTVTLGGIGLYGGHNAVSISDSDLTFNAAAADANVLAKMGTNANTGSTVTLADTTLHAGTNGWSLAPIDNVTVTVSGTTTVDLGGKQISLEGTSIGGKFVFDENTTGTLLLSSADGSLEETLTLNGATVGFAGIWDLSALDDGSSQPTYEGGESDKNGYKAFSTTVTLADLQAGGSITEASLTAAEFYISDVKGTLDLATGKVATSSERDYTVFHVNEGTEKVSKAREGSQSLQSIDVKEGATLNVDQDANLSLISAVSGATVEIASGKVLTVDGSATTTATIAGSGTYALKEGSRDMVGSLAGGWTGTVVLSHASNVAKLNLNDYGHENSKVKIDGVTAWLYDRSAAFEPELVLGAGGLTMVDGYSTSEGSDTTYTFDGGVSGAGDITFQHKAGAGKAVQQTLNFTGDVTRWTGSLNLVHGFTVNAYFNEQEVNAEIKRQGGTLNVYADGTTFNRGVTASSLTAQNGVTIKNTGDNQVDMGSVTIDANSTLGLYKGDITTAENEATLLIAQGKTLTVAEQGSLNADLVLNAGSKLDVSGTLGEGLIMGSDVSMYTGDLLAVTPEGGSQTTDEALVDAYLRAFFAQGDHEYYTLFTGVDTFSINDIVQTKDLTFTDWLHFSLDASRVFDNLIENTYALVYDMDGGVGLGEGTVALKLIPEPTTGTLSLLALMALAARRRKH